MAKISETYRNFGWQYGRQRHLYYIVHIDNVPSILAKGVRSHNAMSFNDVDHKDVSLAEVQRRRANVSFERLGTKLHDYANVYFDARNPMMYYLKCHREDFPVEFCVLAIDYGVLDLEGTLVTDSNAAYGLMRCDRPETMIGLLDFGSIFARSWRDLDEIEMARKKAKKCAEVLVMGSIPPEYIRGAYVPTEATQTLLRERCAHLKTAIRPDLFFL